MKQRIDILALDAVHPDELPAGESPTALHDLLQQKPIEDNAGSVTPLIGNQAALAMLSPETGCPLRFVEENLAYATANPLGSSEQQRMYELETEVFPSYDLLLDRHGAFSPGPDWAFCHHEAVPEVWQLIAALGLKHVIHYEPGHMGSKYKNYLGMDLGPHSTLKAPRLHGLLQEWLSSRQKIGTKTAFLRYQVINNIRTEDAERLGLPPTYPAFVPLPAEAAKELGYPDGTMTHGADLELYRHTGYYAEVIVPLQK